MCSPLLCASSATKASTGDTPLGAQLTNLSDIRRWLERFGRLVPKPRFEIQRLVASGPPWNQRLASHVLIRSTVNGEPYQNQFAHFLTLHWGKVCDDLILEDTQMWGRACQRLVAAGVGEAAEAPLVGAATVPPVRDSLTSTPTMDRMGRRRLSNRSR